MAEDLTPWEVGSVLSFAIPFPNLMSSFLLPFRELEVSCICAFVHC